MLDPASKTREKVKNLSLDVTFLTHEEQELEELMNLSHPCAPSHHDSMDSDSPKKYTQQLPFVSVCKEFEKRSMSEALEAHKNRFPFVNLPKFIAEQEELTSCICGKVFIKKQRMINHIEEHHGTNFHSIEYVLAQEYMSQNKLFSMKFLKERFEYISYVKQQPYQHIKLIFEMTLITSTSLEREIQRKLAEIKRIPLKQKGGFDFGLSKIYHRKQSFFSQDFMEFIRFIIVKYCSTFNRCLSTYLNNISIKEMVFIFVCSLTPYLDFLKKRQLKKTQKWKDTLTLSKMIESVVWYFLFWIDKNFKKIFDKNEIFHSHIELEEDEKYSSSQRLWQFDLFTSEFLNHCRHLHLGNVQERVCQFLMTSLSQFKEILEEGHPIQPDYPRKRQRLQE